MALAARAVGEAGVDDGRSFVHAAADGGNDAGDDSHEMGIIAKGNFTALEAAAALDVNFVVVIDENVGDGIVFEKLLERAEAEIPRRELLWRAARAPAE